MKTAILVLLLSFSLSLSPSIELQSNSKNLTPDLLNISYSSAQLTPHPPIVIDGNNDFVNQAKIEKCIFSSSPQHQ